MSMMSSADSATEVMNNVNKYMSTSSHLDVCRDRETKCAAEQCA